MNTLLDELKSAGNSEKSAFLPRFFKTGPGEYGEGDQFLGVTVPQQRAIAKRYFQQLSIQEYTDLIKSPFHEVRLTTLLMLVYRYEKTKSEEGQKELVEFYLSNLDFVNNWDLVDSSGYQILGHFYWKKDTRFMASSVELPPSIPNESITSTRIRIMMIHSSFVLLR